MVDFLSMLDKLLAAAPTLLSERALSQQHELGTRRRWSDALHATYDEVLKEPVPSRLVEMVRRERSRKG